MTSHSRSLADIFDANVTADSSLLLLLRPAAHSAALALKIGQYGQRAWDWQWILAPSGPAAAAEQVHASDAGWHFPAPLHRDVPNHVLLGGQILSGIRWLFVKFNRHIHILSLPLWLAALLWLIGHANANLDDQKTKTDLCLFKKLAWTAENDRIMVLIRQSYFNECRKTKKNPDIINHIWKMAQRNFPASNNHFTQCILSKHTSIPTAKSNCPTMEKIDE
jgi:hypothetical protein